MSLRTVVLTLACTAGLAGPAHAQKGGDDVPKEYRPPAGMCRIWLDRVPPRQQPAPTDCPTAVRNRPANGRVIFGDDYVEKRGKKDTPDDFVEKRGRNDTPDDYVEKRGKKDAPFARKFGGDRKRP